MKKIVIAAVAIIVLAAIVFFVTPVGRGFWNKYRNDLQKTDDVTRYESKKKVEDTCRAMIASYEADVLMYEQYKDVENPEERGWGAAARTRANQTASTYNAYVLKNKHIWAGNVPEDIRYELATI